MSTAMIQSGGMQSVRKRQLVYLDFDGESTSYRGEVLQLEHVEVGSSRLDAQVIASIVSKLNSEAEDVFYVTERPVDVPYSIVFVGYTASFAPYGDFAGLAETIDHGNQRSDDNAFVILKGTESADAIAGTIAHEVAHLTGTLDHGGEGLAAYAYGNWYEVSSGVTSTNVVLDADYMNVLSGGMASNTTVNVGGYMGIDSGGVANRISVNAGGSMDIFGSALNVIWTPCVGQIYVGYGAYVTYQNDYSGCYFGSDDQLLSQGMTMAGKIVSGSMYIFSGGVANSTAVNDGGYMGIYSGGIATRTTANGGSMYVSSGGVANSTTVNAEGYMRIYSGGSAVNIIWTPCVGKVRIQEGAYVTYQSRYSGCYFGSDNQLLSQGMTMTSKTVTATVSMFIFSGGVANDTTVNDIGSMSIASSGVANNTNVSFNGFMSISSGSVANSTIVNGGFMTISSGGIANRTSLNGGGVDILSGGAAKQTTVNDGGSMYVSSGGVANNTTLESGSMYISSGGVANSTILESGGGMLIHSGGVANSTIINAGGNMYITSGGSALNVIWTPCVGRVYTKNGAYVTYQSNYSGCYFGADDQLLSQGMIMTGKNFSGYNGSMYVFSGGVANSITLAGGFMAISSGGVANSTTVNGWVEMDLSSGGVANSTIVNGGYMYIESGGVANSTTVNGGCDYGGGFMTITSGGVANSATVDYLGCMWIESGGKVTGNLTIEDGARVSAEGGAIIDFNLTGRNASDGYLINNLNLISGSPDFTITVSATQSGGVYRLAEGADCFSRSISIGDGSISFGSLTVNGDTVSVGYYKYSLLEQDGILSLAVDQATRPAPTGLRGSAAGLSWTGSPGASVYQVEYSRDNFVTVARFTTDGTALDSFNLANGSYQWRVRATGGLWSEETAFTVSGNGSRPPQTFTAADNGVEDLFTVKTIGTWNSSYLASNTLTGETVRLTGKNRFADQFTGSDDHNVLWLTDDANGDAFFLDDRYTDRPSGTSGARFAAIDEIRAGGGDDVVDLSSFRFGYEGLTLRGGDGNDMLWANSGGNHLFGDAGNDRLTGGSGDDVIAGGIGDDALHGGGGDDVFTFGGNWGNDTVEEFAGPGDNVTLWFDGIAEADLSIEDRDGNAIFRCGDRSVTVKGLASSAVSLKFGDDQTGEYQSLLAMGAFAEETTRKIYDPATGLLAAV